MTNPLTPSALVGVVTLGGLVLAGPVAAQTWEIRADESQLAFEAEQQGAKFKGEFERFAAEIVFDPADLANASVTVTVDVTSFNSANRDRDGSVGAAAWFHFKEFPKAVFTANEFRAQDEGYVAEGTLSIKGIEQPVSLAFSLEIEGDTARMSGETRLDRTAFNVGTGEWEDPKSVGHSVTVLVDVVADRTGPSGAGS